MTEEERLLQEMMARQNQFYGRFNTTTTPVTAARPAVVTPRVSTPARTITNTVEQQKVLKDLAKSKSFKPSSPTTKWSTGAVSKVPSMAKLIPGLGAAATIYDAFRPSQLATAADATANPGTDFRVTQAYPSMDNVYTDPTAMAYAGVTPPGEEFGSSYAGPNTMGLNRDYDRVKAMFDSPVDFTKIAMSDEIGTGQRAFNDPMGYPTSDSYGVSQGYGDFSPMMGMLTDMVSAEDPTDLSTVTDDPYRAYVSGDEFQERMPAREMGPQETAQFTQPYYENIALDVPDSRFDITVPDPISLGKSYGAVPTGYDARSWDDRFPTIAPDFSSGDFDLGSVEALKAHPFGWAKEDQTGMLSYYDTYAGGTPVTSTFEDNPIGYAMSEIAPRTLAAMLGASPTQRVANTGLVNALATRDFFDSPKGWPAGALDTGRMMGALTDQGFVDPALAQSFVDDIGNIRPSDLSITYDAFGNPSKANISEYMSEIGPIGIAPTNMEVTTSGDPTIPGLNVSSALASPTITAQDQIAAYNAASMGEIASHPGQGGYIGDTERTIGEHLAAVDERVQAMPAVTTSQALSTQDERQQAMPEVSVPAPTAPTVASQAAQNRLAQQQADAAIARAAQAAAARDAARQAQAASAAQAQAAQNAARAVLASAAGRDRGGPSQREINAAREVLSQIDTFDSGGMMTDTQRAMTDVGYGGGFAAGRGDTGATGQGGWT